MKIQELMTGAVVTVRSGTPLKDAAALMAEHHVSGLPVVDAEGRVVGVLSEGDILYKETGRRTKPTLLGMGLRNEDPRATAVTAGDAMTVPAVTVGPDRLVSEAAASMIDNGISRLPVVDDDGRLVGIVTRADLMRAFVRPDEEVAREIREDVFQRIFWIEPGFVHVEVHGGEVELSGAVETKADAELVPVLVERVPGVVGVLSKLRWQADEG